MKRRRILQAGLSLVAAPLAGCAPPPAAQVQPGPPPAPAALQASSIRFLPEAHTDFVISADASPSASAPPPGPAPAASTAAAPPVAKPALERVVSRVGTNHGHVFHVPLDDVKAGVTKTYDLTGTAGHGHSVTLEADALARLQAGEVVRLPSTKTGHLHRLLIKLAPAVDPPEAVNVCNVTIGGKDDHEMIVTAADMAAKADKTYDIQGVAAHTHTVCVTTGEFDRLARGDEVTISTSAAEPGQDHGHVVFLRYPLAKAAKAGGA